MTSDSPAGSLKILVYGAGSIGGYIGGTLLAAGMDVTFLGRERVRDEFHQNGMRLTDYQGREANLSPDEIPFVTNFEEYGEKPDIVLLTVKCTGLAQAAQELCPHIDESTLVVCCQNGIGTREAVSTRILSPTVSGMVGFNVAWSQDSRLHRGTDGKLLLEAHPKLKPLVEAWRLMGVPAGTTESFTEVAWGKLLLNLNNAVNALAGVPLKEELSDRNYRRVLSACMRELLAALSKAGIKPTGLAKAPPFLIPWILLLPNWLFRVIAKQMLAIDPLARSSMWDDLNRGRTTEIEFLNQAVVELAYCQGLTAPVNERIVRLVREAEIAGNGSPHLSGEALVRATLHS